MGCLLGKIKSVAARWCDLEPQLRPSNEAVWGGNFEDLNDPKRGIRVLRIRISVHASEPPHSIIFLSRNQHTP